MHFDTDFLQVRQKVRNLKKFKTVYKGATILNI